MPTVEVLIVALVIESLMLGIVALVAFGGYFLVTACRDNGYATPEVVEKPRVRYGD